MNVKIVNRSHHPLPAYETLASAGMDLRAFLEFPVTLGPLERTLVPTGLFIELPIGFEAQIRPRSGMALKKGLSLVNTPGTIDADYRGEIKLIVINLSQVPVVIEDGDRVAQMVIARHERVEWTAVDTLEETTRGTGGFGHTGSR